MVCAGCPVEHPQSEGSLLPILLPFCRRLLEAWGISLPGQIIWTGRTYLASLPACLLYIVTQLSGWCRSLRCKRRYHLTPEMEYNENNF